MKIKTSFITNSSTCNFIMIGRKISKQEAMDTTDLNISAIRKENSDDWPIECESKNDVEKLSEAEYEFYSYIYQGRISSEDFERAEISLDLQNIPIQHVSEYKLISMIINC